MSLPTLLSISQPSTTKTAIINSNNDNSSTDALTQRNNNDTQSSTITITKLLAKNLENHLQKAGAILEITSKLPQVRDVSYAYLLNQTLDTLHGIPQYADIEKRQVAKNIIASNSDLWPLVEFNL